MKKLILILIPVFIFGFNFNGYKSGFTTEDVVAHSKEKNIPITTNVAVIGKGFKLTNLSKNYKKANRLQYPDKIAGGNAWVYLYFTKQSKKLYKIEINWSVPYASTADKLGKNDISKIIEEILTKKYGSYKTKILDTPTKMLINSVMNKKRKIWTINKDNFVVLEDSSFQLKATYVDILLYNKNKREITTIKHKKKLNASKEDFNKF